MTALATFWLDGETVGGYRFLRCEVPARHLPAAAVMSTIYDPELQQGGTAIFRSRLVDPRELEGLRRAKADGIRVVLDIEDNHRAPREERPDALVAPERGGGAVAMIFGPKTPSREIVDEIIGGLETLHREAVEIADALIVPTESTAAAYSDHPEVHVVPNAIDPELWPPLEKPSDDVFRIGLFLSKSHGDDLELVVDALHWASLQPAVEVIVLGVWPRTELTWREYATQQAIMRGERLVSTGPDGEIVNEPLAFLDRYKARQARWNFNYRHVAPSFDYDRYRALMMELDVGLAPLVETPWSRCRADSKPLEYAMCAALPVCSDAEPYRPPWPYRWPWVDDDDSRGHGFINRLAWCIANRDEAREHGRRWRERVLEHRTIATTIDAWREAVLGAPRSTLVRSRRGDAIAGSASA